MTTQTLTTATVADLVVDLNVRTDTKLDKSFVSSIRNHGIIQPPVGWQDDDGRIHITVGQRRTLAALEIGLETIDVIVKPKELAEGDRIVTQLTENDQRQELTDSERLHGYKQLAMFGVSVDQIARKTNKPKGHVQTALAVAESAIAFEALETMPIDLEQASIIAEFQDDPEAVNRLLQVAAESPTSIPHEAQRIRDRRAFEAERETVEQQLALAGWAILSERPSYEDKTICRVDALWRADDPEQTRLTLDEALTLPGASAVVTQAGWEDRGAGRLTSVSHYLADYRTQGFVTHDYHMGKQPLTDEEKAERKAQRAQAADLRSATVVRREWIGSFLANAAALKSLRVDVVFQVCATVLNVGLGSGHPDKKAYTLAAELLGLEVEQPDKWSSDCPARRTLAERLLAETDDPLRIALAVAIANYEYVAGDPSIKWVPNDPRTGEYFELLEFWGYTLSDVEKSIVKTTAKKGRKK